jgi:lysine 2,3-aminomutase
MNQSKQIRTGDWRWQWKHRLTSADSVCEYFSLSSDDALALAQAEQSFPIAITQFYAELIEKSGCHPALWKQVIPDPNELYDGPQLSLDPLAEERDSPLPGLVHRYADRVLLLLTDRCAVYCRHCNRRRYSGSEGRDTSPEEIDDWVEYLNNHLNVREVILSGGDPLSLTDAHLDAILKKLRRVKHLSIIRFGTRIPVALPYRITNAFCRMLKRYEPVYLNIHINHPLELTNELAEACRKLRHSGISLGSQTVLLKGINDQFETLQELFPGLLNIGVKPYALYHPDPVQGTAHFRLSIARGLEIMDQLIAHTSGLAIPHYLVDAPDGRGKIPLLRSRYLPGDHQPSELTTLDGKRVDYWDGE